jgi:hypothetical protein
MQKFVSRLRIGIVAAAVAAFALPMLAPTPAAAWGYHRGGYRWHAGYGWHRGWGYGWHRGCCWGPGVVVGVAPPVVVVPGPVWIRPHWNGPYWVPGHWG